MPAIVASWLAGQYDSDKSVSRAANESFNRVFGSEEKKRNVWRLYQSSISEYSRDVIMKETTYTLSDERTSSPDDASAKYSRVVGAAITVVSNLLGQSQSAMCLVASWWLISESENTSKSDLEKSQTLIEELLNKEKVWNFASHDDPYVRRALYRLLVVALAKEKNALNPSLVSANILTAGLHTNQASSAFDFAKAIAALSMDIPDVWTVHYTGSGKKSAQNRLCHFLKRGSQGGPAEFWNYISTLISQLPSSILISADGETIKTEDAEHRSYSPVLSALHEGLNSKNEVSANQGAAWNTYLDASERVRSSLDDANDRHQFYKASVFPILTQYIRPSPEQSRWVISGPQQMSICMRVCSLALLGDPEAFNEEWQSWSMKVIEDLKTSLPEQSKDFTKSQEAVSAEADRWYHLQASLLGGSSAESTRPIVKESVSSEVPSIVSILKDRNGKPYAAAAALEALIRTMAELVLTQDVIKDTMIDFVNKVLPNILLSPSAKHLIRLLEVLEDKIDVRQSYQNCMQTLGDAPESTAKSVALQSFISSRRLGDTDSLYKVVMASLQHAMRDDDAASWSLVMAAASNPVAPKKLTDEILAGMTEDLTINAKSSAGLNGLEKIAKQNQGVLRDFALSTRGSVLISRLLILADSPDATISQRAKNLDNLLERALVVDGGSCRAVKTMIEMVNEGLDKAGPESLSYVTASYIRFTAHDDWVTGLIRLSAKRESCWNRLLQLMSLR